MARFPVHSVRPRQVPELRYAAIPPEVCATNGALRDAAQTYRGTERARQLMERLPSLVAGYHKTIERGLKALTDPQPLHKHGRRFGRRSAQSSGLPRGLRRTNFVTIEVRKHR
jgi:hypothetical protein